MEPTRQKNGIRVPIAVKLIAIMVIVLLSATIPISFKSSSLFEEVSSRREEDSNRSQASTQALEVENFLVSIIDKAKVVASLLINPQMPDDQKQNALDMSFFRDRDLVSIEVLSNSQLIKVSTNLATQSAQKTDEELTQMGLRLEARRTKDTYLRQYKLTGDHIAHLRKMKPFPILSSFSGKVEVKNSSVAGSAPLLTIGFPFVKDDLGRVTHIAIADVRLDQLQKVFANVKERTMYLVDREGFLLAHPNEEWVMNGYSMKHYPIVQLAISNQESIRQRRYLNPDDSQYYIGAYAPTAVGVSIIVQAAESVIMEPSRKVRREAFFIMGLVLSSALLFISIFSFTLTSPIEKLSEMTRQVEKGNFNIHSNVHSNDEVGELAHAFDNMVVGLREREKMRNVLNKFHGSVVADDLLKGDLELGGSKKRVTVFFSDIRGFTKFSETRQPEQIVTMLNEYFARMVSVINQNKGVVDKFIGDAIMAVWGAPKSTDQDTKNALKACLQMRQALAKLNGDRISRGEDPIKIGMALHTGYALSGTIGSSERMEYTVIGDTVNMASRIEASTKTFGTDLLVSEQAAASLTDQFIFEEAGQVEVKGKSEPLSLFKVKGFYDPQQMPVFVKTPYSDFEPEDADKVKKVA